jgi:protein-S-isoprenylcysteine O-methyltransferase Ste14
VLWILRQLVAIVVLPFMVAVVIPVWLARRDGMRFGLGSTLGEILLQAGGLGLLAVGVVLFLASLGRFMGEGRGTLAPWDPPRRLVVQGPYRYVRNPMISGVVFLLLGEALILRSGPHAAWVAIFTTANALWIPLFEEPQLESRFGDEYRRYCQHVPRLLPRLRPWEPS